VQQLESLDAGHAKTFRIQDRLPSAYCDDTVSTRDVERLPHTGKHVDLSVVIPLTVTDPRQKWNARKLKIKRSGGFVALAQRNLACHSYGSCQAEQGRRLLAVSRLVHRVCPCQVSWFMTHAISTAPLRIPVS
jgi:hypothetical protein